jgi:HTH-type transcriptional regulator / antitoxin HigA
MKYTVIKSKDQYNDYCRQLEQLLNNKSSEEEIELLTLLIESWDREHNSIEGVDGVNVLRYLMREHGLKAVEVADIVGVGRTQISDILNNKRAIPTGMALRLGRHFKLRSKIFEIEGKSVKT